MRLMNKRGGEELLSVWWILILVIIAVGIAVSVIAFYSYKADVRMIEAESLSEKLADCFVQEGYLVDDFMAIDVFSDCGLKKEVFDEGELFYFKIEFLDETGNSARELIEGGVLSWQELCNIQFDKNEKEKNFPQCMKKEIYTQTKDNKKIKVVILTASNQGR